MGSELSMDLEELLRVRGLLLVLGALLKVGM